MRSNIIVRLIALPCSVRGFTLADEDGNYNVYLNDRLSREMQRRVYKHELRHIARGDLFSELSARYLEFN